MRAQAALFLLVLCLATTTGARAQADSTGADYERWRPLLVPRIAPVLGLTYIQQRKLSQVDRHYRDAERILLEGAERVPPKELQRKYHNLVLRGMEEVRAVLDSAQYAHWLQERERQGPPQHPVQPPYEE